MPSARSDGFAVISGGSSGIGLACAAGLIAKGCRVALIARDAERLASAKSALEKEAPGARIMTRSIDVADAPAVIAALRDLIAIEGAPNWVVASAGIALPGRFLDQDADTCEMHMRINYLGAVNLVRACTPAMVERGSGRIVLISSGAGLAGVYGYSAYSPTKFAVRGFGEVLSVELAACGVSVTVAHPPDTDTPQYRNELPLRPVVTSIVANGGGLWQPRIVANKIIAAAERGKFYVGPGIGVAMLALFGGISNGLFRARQIKLARSVEPGRGGITVVPPARAVRLTNGGK